MTPDRRKVLRATLLFVPLFLLFAAGYLAVKPYYEPTVQRTAAVVTRHLSPPTWIDTGPNSLWRCHVQTAKDPNRIIYRWNTALPHLIFLNLAMLPALTLATPTTWRNRLKITGLAIVLMFAGHVVVLAGLSRGIWCLVESPGYFPCMWLLRLLYISGQAFGAAIWVLLTWRYWFPDRHAAPPA